jgi:hypothetical protein
MRVCLMVIVTLCAIGCTRPNPLDCSDGTCTDPAFPFCDQDGSVAGHPETCIAVTCNPGDFAACRGDEMLRCNTTGNDYEITQCEHGCDAASSGCVSCLDNTQCANPAPACDATTHTCRGCSTDADCASEVCDTSSGACVDPSTIIYASPDGAVAGACGSQATPCVFSRAFAQLDSVLTTVKLRSGDYTEEVSIVLMTPMGETRSVDGSGATVQATTNEPVFVVTGPGKFHIWGLTFTYVKGGDSHSNNSGILCGDNTSSTNTLLEAEQLTFVGGYEHVDVESCEAMFRRVRFSGAELGPGGYSGNLVGMVSHGIATFDQCLFESIGMSPSSPLETVNSLDPVGVQVHIMNSIFRGTADMFITQGAIDIQFSTFVNLASPIDCTNDSSGGDKGKRIYSNNLFVNTSGADIAAGSACTYHYDLMSSQHTPVVSDHMIMNVDPMLKDLANGDYHLLPGSQAAGAADPAATLTTDYDGYKRTDGGPRRDLGAFELHP